MADRPRDDKGRLISKERLAELEKQADASGSGLPEAPSMTADEARAEQAAEVAANGIADFDDSASVEPQGPSASIVPRCSARNAANAQCLFEVHSEAFAHQFEELAPPRISAEVAGRITAAPAGRVPVGRQNAWTWWCGRCDNSQQIKDAQVCRKCGAVPEMKPVRA